MLIAQGTKRHFLPRRRLHNTGAGKNCHGHRHVLLLYKGATGLSRLLHDITEKQIAQRWPICFNRLPKKHRAGRKGKKAPPHHKLYNRSLLHGPLTSSKIKTATAGAYVHGLYNGCLEDMLLVCMKGASCLRALHLVHRHCTNSDQRLMNESSPHFPTAAGAAVGSLSTLMPHASLPALSSSTRSSHARG